MTGLVPTANAPLIFTITPRVCDCPGHPTVFATGRKRERIESVAAGYWRLFVDFFGDQLVWLHFEVIDTRDGQLLWRNGVRQGEGNGKLTLPGQD